MKTMELWRLFEVCGVEIEYMIVDAATLDVRPFADRILLDESGLPVSEVSKGDISWTCELMNHLIEFKADPPPRSLSGLSEKFRAQIGDVNRLLRPFGARLMPTAMHPWMDPRIEARLWPHEYSSVYATFDRVFDCTGHGWANLQSTHINLPFADDEEFGRLHAAVRMVLPILPAIAASSPIVEGKLTGLQDNRLEMYRTNCAFVASVIGNVIPEPVFTRHHYEERIFAPMYDEIARHDPGGILRHEWLNARGAIARFSRGSIEIRLLDVQECSTADLAVCALVVQTVRALAEGRWTSPENLCSWSAEHLASILVGTIRDADQYHIGDPRFLASFGYVSKNGCRAGELWRHVITDISGDIDAEYIPTLELISSEGPLSRRILAALSGRYGRSDLRRVYARLCDCLETNEPFQSHH